VRFSYSTYQVPVDQLLPLAQAAEQVGFDGVSVPDSVFYPEAVSADYPYTFDGSRMWGPEDPYPEPWVLIPALAAVTERLRFYPSVYKVAIRQPLLMAKTVASATALAGPGRIAFGIGLSWMPEEFEWLSEDMRTRGKRVDEAMEIFRLALQPDPGWIEYHGQHYDFDKLTMSPPAGERVPLLVGGLSEPAFNRAARLGDGWISVMNTVEEVTHAVTRLTELRKEHGRDLDEPFEVLSTPLIGPDPKAFAELEAEGVTEAIVVPWMYYPGDGSLASRVDALQQFHTEVITPING
jgi:probable F420-dependent oxidoreductase